MRIFQMLSTIAYGDAVSNDAIALEKLIKEMGYKSRIYAESIVPPLDKKTVLNVKELPELNEDDIVIYHYSSGSELNYRFGNFKCRKVLVYHNVTPPKFFERYDERFAGVCSFGLEGIKYLADKVDYALAVSEFNRQDLISYGFKCKIDILPIIIPMEDYNKKPDKYRMKEWGDGKTNILFTGRVAPNKCHEDLIKSFYYYSRLYNHNSRLILAGSFRADDPYYISLDRYTRKLGLDRESEIIYTGHVQFNEIIAAYRCADVYLCLSEHEGFCVPLVESMIYNVPVIAYASTAIPDTLSSKGFLIDDKDPVFVAGCIDRVVRDGKLREQLLSAQNERLKDFAYEKIAAQFKEYMNSFIQGKG